MGYWHEDTVVEHRGWSGALGDLVKMIWIVCIETLMEGFQFGHLSKPCVKKMVLSVEKFYVTSSVVWYGMVLWRWIGWSLWCRLEWSSDVCIGIGSENGMKTLWWRWLCIWHLGWPGEDGYGDGLVMVWIGLGMVMDALLLPDLWRHGATIRMTAASLTCLYI